MIVVRTKYDTPTEYLFLWTEKIISEAEKSGLKVTKVEGSKVNFDNFGKRIKKLNPKFVFFNGHGNKSSLYDSTGKDLINLQSANLLKGTITFARACDSLVKLGEEAVKKGCKSFIGYNKKFWIPRWHKTTCRPLKDLAAKPVLECSNLIASQLIKGRTVSEAVDNSHEKAVKSILSLVYSNEPFASPALAALMHNDSALDFKGNPLAKIY